MSQHILPTVVGKDRVLLTGNGFTIAALATEEKTTVAQKEIGERVREKVKQLNPSEDSDGKRWRHTLIKYFDASDLNPSQKDNIEQVISYLEIANFFFVENKGPISSGKALAFKDPATWLRQQYIEIIQSGTHGRFPKKAGDFSTQFHEIFTVNYDPILDKEAPTQFTGGPIVLLENGIEYPSWHKDIDTKQKIYYLHGAFHLLKHDEDVVNCGTEKTLTELALPNSHESDSNPRAESHITNKSSCIVGGTSREKRYAINKINYLKYGLDKLGRLSKEEALYTYGFNFNENDSHITDAIDKSNVYKVFVGVYGDIEHTLKLAEQRLPTLYKQGRLGYWHTSLDARPAEE